MRLYELGRGSKYGYCGLSWTKDKWINGCFFSLMAVYMARLIDCIGVGWIWSFCYVMIARWFLGFPILWALCLFIFIYSHTIIVRIFGFRKLHGC